MVHAGITGVIRAAESIASGRVHLDNPDSVEDRFGQDVLGAMGEIAAAKFGKAYWSASFNTFRSAPDIEDARGPVEVRTTRRHTNKLRLHHNDAPQLIVVSVTGSPPDMWIRGWIRAGDWMRPEYRDPNRGRGWFVPQALLNPFPILWPEPVWL